MHSVSSFDPPAWLRRLTASLAHMDYHELHGSSNGSEASLKTNNDGDQALGDDNAEWAGQNTYQESSAMSGTNYIPPGPPLPDARVLVDPPTRMPTFDLWPAHMQTLPDSLASKLFEYFPWLFSEVVQWQPVSLSPRKFDALPCDPSSLHRCSHCNCCRKAFLFPHVLFTY